MKFTRHGVFSNKFARESNVLRAASISGYAAVVIGFRARSKISHPEAMLGIRGRNVSLKIRFALLRWTAFPIERPAATAKRDLSISFGRAINTINGKA
jgi:hypothetical protein